MTAMNPATTALGRHSPDPLHIRRELPPYRPQTAAPRRP
jgi:hypothetical protein